MAQHQHHITVTYLNIRQSINILLFKLVAIELILAIGVIFITSTLFFTGAYAKFNIGVNVGTYAIYLFFVLLKISILVYVILQWLTEYYEITLDEVVHKRGIIYTKTERYKYLDIKLLHVEQNLLGRVFNFGTISLYDWKIRKQITMYLIHDPMRYTKILESLLPNLEVEEERDVVRRSEYEE